MKEQECFEMKKNTKIIIIIALAIAVIAGGITVGLIVSKNRNKPDNSTTTTTTLDGTGHCVDGDGPTEENTTEESTTEEAEIESTKENPEVNNPKKTYNAPVYFSSKGDCAEYEIEWHDDNTLRIIDTAFDDNEHYFDITINEYGEVVNAVNYFTNPDEDGSKKAEKRDFWYVPKYNDQHQLVGAIEKNDDRSTDCEWQYIYNSDGQRIKRIYRYEKEMYETVYKYNKDGDLAESIHKKFEPTGEDRTFTYDEYWESEKGLISSGGYDGVAVPAFSADVYLKKNKSDAYEKVTKAQHDFFYNTLIYYIIDTNEDVL